MTPSIIIGLSLLPKIPSMWEKVAKLFKKDVPTLIQEAEELSKNIKNSYIKGEISKEDEYQLERIILEYRQEILRINLEEQKLLYQDIQGIRDLEIESYKSNNIYISQTRPKILRGLFASCVIYSFFIPILIMICFLLKIDIEILNSLIELIRWIGGFLFSTFISGYLGYTAARSMDKKNNNNNNNNNNIDKIIKNILNKEN